VVAPIVTNPLLSDRENVGVPSWYKGSKTPEAVS